MRYALPFVVLTLGFLTSGVAEAQSPGLRYSVGLFGRFTADGMLVQRVVPDSPAERAGMLPGDLIFKVDGHLITSQEEFAAVINSSGGAVVLIVRKSGNGRIVRVGLDLLGGRGGPPAPYALGVTGTFVAEGLRIQSVAPGTAAARIGLEKGDTIGRINNTPINNQADFFGALATSGGTITLLVRKGNGRVVRLDADLTVYELGVVGEFGREGILIGAIAPHTPAAWAGLQRGDVIQRIDNRPVRSQAEFEAAIRDSGGAVTLLVRRGMRTVRIHVDLMNNPLGAWCEPSPEGMRITAIVPASPADLIGLTRGDVLVKVDDYRVRTQAELLFALRQTRGLVTLLVRRAGTERLVRLEVDLFR